MIRYASVCSGIEAATAAWHPLGWQAQWFSEIEPNPCRVLQHHYPSIPNLGDMTALDNNEIYANSQFDLLVGGTPCQSFSVAGLRNGLDDERGNLALEFIRILMRKRPKWFLWENVPGVLSSTGGADFAAILSGFTGTDVEPQKFTTSGIISGPFYSVAWRVLDSQYIGVPQRRRRVFVVGHLGNDWRPSAAVLFERESMRGHTAPRKRARQETAGTTEDSAGAANFCISGNTVDRATRQNGTGVTDKGVFTLTKTDRHAVVYGAQPILLNDQGGSVMEVNTQGLAPTLRAQTHGNNPIVCYDTTKGCLNPSAPQAWRVHTVDTVSPTLDASKGRGHNTHIILAPNYVVRRLTPLECERLQGFPDNYTNVAGLSDSARYAAIGNSMTVNVMRWIGKRINYVHYCLSL